MSFGPAVLSGDTLAAIFASPRTGGDRGREKCLRNELRKRQFWDFPAAAEKTLDTEPGWSVAY